MKSKKVALIAVIACSLLIFASIPAMAAGGWFTATVVSSTAGQQFQCQLTGTEEGGSRTFTNKIFLLLPDIQNAELAVLLSAQSMGASVRVFVDPDVGQFPTIYGIGLVNQQ